MIFLKLFLDVQYYRTHILQFIYCLPEQLDTVKTMIAHFKTLIINNITYIQRGRLDVH